MMTWSQGSPTLHEELSSDGGSSDTGEGGSGGDTSTADCMAASHDNVECDDDGLCTITGDSDDPVVDDLTLTNDCEYLLGGPVFIGDDEDETVLEIEAGTTIYGVEETYMVIQRSSKIIADGTESDPIVFTSLGDEDGNKATGDWGGLVINGRAPINLGDEAAGEADSGTYGGDDPEDDSGVLHYVRVEFAGNQVDAENELNGIAFQGVGSGTEVDYVQIHYNQDDGMEFFGGTVSGKHIMITGAGDDGFDWTNGWSGNVQFVYVEAYEGGGERGVEADNQETDFSAEPVSDPTLSNFTLVGVEDNEVGMKLRRGTHASINNFVVANFPAGCLSIDDPDDTEVEFNNTIIACDTSFVEDGDSTETEDTFNAGDNNAEIDVGDLGVDDSWVPEADSPLLGVGDSPDEDFFDSVDYAGAFDEGEDWREGWTTLDNE